MVDLKAVNHTNRELELMLEGQKPLAVFYAELSELPNEELIPIERFQPYVARGDFVQDEAIFDGPLSASLGRDTKIKYVLYAVKGHEWRIPAYLLVKTVGHRTGHNESLERLESALLGYSQEEIDAWCDLYFRSSAT